MTSVICVLFKPAPIMATTVNQSVYNPDWVEKLQRGVQRNLNCPHRFVCITDHHESEFSRNVEVHPFIYKKHKGTWMSINECLNPALDLGLGIMMGLDTIVQGNITGLADYKGEFAMLKPPNGDSDGWNGVTLFRNQGALWREYLADPDKAREESKYKRWAAKQGSENLWWCLKRPGFDYIQDACPDVDIKSYKYEREAAEHADLVYFQGRHKPDTSPEDWVKPKLRESVSSGSMIVPLACASSSASMKTSAARTRSGSAASAFGGATPSTSTSAPTTIALSLSSPSSS